MLVMGSSAAYLFWKTDSYPENIIVLNAAHGKVTIRRDRYGIPHITSTLADLDVFYALGYIHAKDRLWQMELNRHVVKGSLSEIFGKDTLLEDKYIRTWGYYRSAEKSWEALSPATQAIIKSYTAGINAYIVQGKLPLQLILLNHRPELWTTTDSYAWAKMLAFQLQNSWQDKIKNYVLAKRFNPTEMAAINQPYPDNAPTVLSDMDLLQSHFNLAKQKSHASTEQINDGLIQSGRVEAQLKRFLKIKNISGKGSNNWVVSGKYTKNGYPLLANDPHLELAAPGIWYLAELNAPHLHVTGASLPGLPAIVIGHNDHIAWGMTDAAIDAQDVYLLSPTAKTHIILERINIKKANSLLYPVEVTDDGSPIINHLFDVNDGLEKMSVKWTGLANDDTTVQSFIKLNYAQNWLEFVNSLKDFVTPSQNFIYADTLGNIGYYLSGRIPIRGWSGRYPLPDSNQSNWQQFIPFEQMPHVLNPPEGFIASANNKIISDNFPYQLTYQWRGMPFRIQRISELMKTHFPMDVAAAREMQMDIKSELWNTLRPLLLQTQPLDKSSQHALSYLQAWDGMTSITSIPATIFAFWFQELQKLQPHPFADISDLTNPLFIYSQLNTNGEFCKKAGFKDCREFMSVSLQAAMKKVTLKLGSNENNWRWGYVHHARFNEPIFGEVKLMGWIWNREIPNGGDGYTVNVGSFDENFNQIVGVTYRQIIDLGNLNNSYYILPLGESGNVFTGHYSDLLKLWRNGEFISMGAT